MNGVLVIDKPAGPTSHDVVAVVRRAIGSPKVGHTGTLDPLATGVLPLVIGRATRLASFMSGADKEYVAKIRFGAATATYDAEGREGSGDLPPSAERLSAVAALDDGAVREALRTFEGRFLQTPPPFSAKKIGGTPAYKLARQQKPVEIKPVEVTVRELELCGYGGGLADVRLVCSSGFYVRSLAHDLGQRLGCGAHLEGLRRTRAGEFTLDDAVSLETVVVGGAPAAGERLVAMERLLPMLPAVVVSDLGAERVSHGSALRPEDLALAGRGDGGVSSGEALASAVDCRLRLLDQAGSLLGLAERRADGLLHPVVVLV
jgi:tRNA pseudouridine55 synthase